MTEGGRAIRREQLLALSNFSEDDLTRAERAGVIQPAADGYRAVDLVKLQLVRQVADSSGGLDRVLNAYEEGRFTLAFLETFLPQEFELRDETYAEVLAEAQVPLEEAEAVLRACGLPVPSLDAPIRSDDYEAFQHMARMRALPVPLEARLHAIRVQSDGLQRAAEVPVKQFNAYIEQPLLQAYAKDHLEAQRLIAEIARAALPTTIGITNWLYGRFLEHEILKDVAVAMEGAARGDWSAAHSQEHDPVIAFVDLVGFTPLAADEGDVEAAGTATMFYDRLLDLARAHGGRLVKMLGDGAMLTFPNGVSAVAAGLEMARDIPAAGLPPARIGLNRGPVVEQSGDMYGLTVNLAARINEYARPNEVLLSASVLPDGAAGVDLEPIGDVTLKGIPRPVTLFRARAVENAAD